MGVYGKFGLIVCMLAAAFVSCEKLSPSAPAGDSIFDGPVDGLTPDQGRQFLAGDRAFNTEVFTSATGLGPLFVATSCGSCHAGDGKGHPFSTLTRFGQTDSTGNTFLAHGGPQLQNHALPGFVPEQIPVGATFAKFTPPANTGLGLLELVSDQDILSFADPDDADGDGISGVPNWIKLPPFIAPAADAVTRNGSYIHRFGKKAAAYNLLHQTVNAYNQDMGITSSFQRLDAYSGLETDPEVTDQTINNVVFYLKTLKAPLQRRPGDPDVIRGGELFMQTGCGACHRQNMTTGRSAIAAISQKLFHPYTDLLLHDMGAALDDHYTEGNAQTAEWRTPPLWGLGLSPNSQGGEYFLLHDGRAKTIEEAILLHDGEGAKSKSNFNQLTQEEKMKLLTFLKSL